MKVCVSGATGFLGQHTLSLLLQQGFDALGTSRHLSDEKRKILKVDDFSKMPDSDILIHFSESNNRFQVNEIGDHYLKTIEDQTTILARKYPRIIYASSVAVYSEDISHPRKTSEKLIPFDTYSRAKLLAEEIITSSSKSSVAVRIGNAYGPGMSNLNIISAVINQMAQRNPVVKLISGDPVRDYIWCTDIAEALIAMTKLEKGGTFNVANGKGISVKQMCEEVGKILNHSFVLETQKSLPNNQIILDISETLQTFEWKPRTDLRTGLSALIKAIR